MDETTENGPLDIEGKAGIHRSVASLKLAMTVLLAGIGWGLWSLAGGRAGFEDELTQGPAMLGVLCWAVSFVLAVSLACRKERHVHLDLNTREIVFHSSRAWWEVGKRRCPLTEFDTIVVRHLCHSGGEGSDTFTGSVGLRPVNRQAVLWVRSFPTTGDEVPYHAFEFARKLQAMTGLPVAGTGEFNQERHHA